MGGGEELIVLFPYIEYYDMQYFDSVYNFFICTLVVLEFLYAWFSLETGNYEWMRIGVGSLNSFVIVILSLWALAFCYFVALTTVSFPCGSCRCSIGSITHSFSSSHFVLPSWQTGGKWMCIFCCFHTSICFLLSMQYLNVIIFDC